MTSAERKRAAALKVKAAHDRAIADGVHQDVWRIVNGPYRPETRDETESPILAAMVAALLCGAMVGAAITYAILA